MITEEQVADAAYTAFGRSDSWGYGHGPLVINGKSYPIEWIENGNEDYDDSTHDILAVFEVELDGFVRTFAKQGAYRSHYGEEWNGSFFECVAREVTKTEYVPGTTVVKLSASDVENALTEHPDWDGWGELGWELNLENTTLNFVEVNGNKYKVEMIEDGSDRDGREWSFDTYIIFSVGNQIFKKTGHFQSHYGDDWDGPLTEVVQVEKTVKVWEDV